MRSPRPSSPRARLVERQATLRARADGSLRLVVVADTHGRPHPASGRLIAALEPDAILHGGDVGDLAVLEELRKIAPVLAVRGNIDGHAPDLPDVITLDVESDGKGPLRILLLHIAVYGPKLRSEVARMAKAEKAALVVCGHSHVPFIGRDQGINVFNPGSIGPRRFTLPIVMGAIDITPSGVKLRHIEAETGATWLPP